MSVADERIYRIKAALDDGLQVWRTDAAHAAKIREAILEVDKIVDDVIGEVGAYVRVYMAALAAVYAVISLERTNSAIHYEALRELEDLVSLVPNQSGESEREAVIAVRSLINQAGVVT